MNTDVMLAGSQWLSAADYELIRVSVPIVCVDALVMQEGRIALILRDTPDGERWCLTGGRVLRDEPLDTALLRHVRATLGSRLHVRTIRFGTVIEYFTEPGIGKFTDPRKHAIAMTYTAECIGDLEPQGEAIAAGWFRLADLDALEFGFGQDGVIARVLRH